MGLRLLVQKNFFLGSHRIVIIAFWPVRSDARALRGHMTRQTIVWEQMSFVRSPLERKNGEMKKRVERLELGHFMTLRLWCENYYRQKAMSLNRFYLEKASPGLTWNILVNNQFQFHIGELGKLTILNSIFSIQLWPDNCPLK